ncbi:MAG TPA: DUF4126 domain-containing protein [Acidobacteriota bacterium]|jgi:hypothetical protein
MNTDLLWALLLSWGAGIDLYLTVLLAGIVGRMQWMSLPPELDFLSSDISLLIAALLFLIEFVADKIPYVDSFWDAIHTFIRIPAGILLALGAASGMSRQSLFLVGLTAGLIAFGTHGAKASVRLALNGTPEPFTNWFVSIAEDVLITFAYWLFLHHPVILLTLLLFTAAFAWLVIYLLIRIFKRLFRFQRPAELRALNWSVNPKK